MKRGLDQFGNITARLITVKLRREGEEETRGQRERFPKLI
jgi:hypothetical protein